MRRETKKPEKVKNETKMVTWNVEVVWNQRRRRMLKQNLEVFGTMKTKNKEK